MTSVIRKTYRAFYKEDHSKILFKGVSAGRVRACLPPGAKVEPDENSTIGRVDGGDPFEFALFVADGRTIIVIPDPKRGEKG